MDRSPDLIDFRELVSSVPGEGLEELVRHIGQRMDLSPSSSGRGPDGGRDLFFTEALTGAVSKQKIKWLVSCKDKATSNESVSEADLPSSGVRDKVEQHNADGFLLVTTTTPSTGAKSLLDSLDKSNDGQIHTFVWDKSDLTRILLQPENHDLIKQFLPESYRRVKQLTSLEGAVLALGDQLPQPVLDEVLRLVRPYSDSGMKGSQIWLFDPVSARAIDEIVKNVVIDNNFNEAVNVTGEIEFDAFTRLLTTLYARYPQECYQYLLAIAENHRDADLRYNAVQFALDVYGNRIETEDYFRLAKALDDDQSVEDLFGFVIARFVENKLDENSYAFGIGDELDSLSSSTIINDVSVPSLTISRGGSRVDFSGDLEFGVTLQANEGGFQDSYPGAFRGFLDESGFHIESVLIDTSSFYK